MCIVAVWGGVGKTTASAALALGLAAAGRRVAVVTIDPARRLAESLGLEELGNEPRQVSADPLESNGVRMQGELWAMMLDPKGHLRRPDHAPVAGCADARGRARQPHLPAAVQRGRGLTGVHRGREALRPAPRGRLRRPRARHTAVAQRAGLPRRPRPADLLLRRPGAEDAARPDRHRRALDEHAAPPSSSRSSRSSPAST